jgi:hypothetical protein
VRYSWPLNRLQRLLRRGRNGHIKNLPSWELQYCGWLVTWRRSRDIPTRLDFASLRNTLRRRERLSLIVPLGPTACSFYRTAFPSLPIVPCGGYPVIRWHLGISHVAMVDLWLLFRKSWVSKVSGGIHHCAYLSQISGPVYLINTHPIESYCIFLELLCSWHAQADNDLISPTLSKKYRAKQKFGSDQNRGDIAEQ